MKGLTAAFLLLIATMASAATIHIDSAYPSDIDGNPIQAGLGESFYMTAKLSIDSDLNGTYQVRFDLPYASRTTPALNFGGSATVTWGPYTALLDTGIPVKVSVQSASDQAGDPLVVSVNPTIPDQAIEYYGAQKLFGSVGGWANLITGNKSGLKWYSPVPSSGGFQTVVSAFGPGTISTSTPFSQPVLTTPSATSANVQFETVANSVRINAGLLRTKAFSSYKTLPPNVSVWLRSETLVESKSSDIASFVSRALPRNYKLAMSPYDAAQALFQAVVAKVQYTETPVKPDALIALRTGKGDCGYFSALFVASCRNAGIPARAVCGMTMGTVAWHVWAEFWIPGYGWIAADPAYCDGLCSNGSLPLYFGTVPDLNQRVAVTYGFDHTVGGRALPMLQSPAVWIPGGVKVGPVQTTCSVALADND